MPPVVIAAAVGLAASAAAAAGIISITTALVITIAASAAAALLTKTKVPSLGAYTSQAERKQVLRSSSAPQVYIYGRTVTSGLLFFAEEEKGSQEKEWLHLAIAIAGHEIDGIEQVWLGDDVISSFGLNATWELHNNRQTVDPFMLANCASWKNDMIGKGIAWVRVSLKFDQDKFPAGLPNIKFQVRGKKVLDPRSNTVAWRNNAALCILDFYRSVCGVPDSQIDMNQFIQAANISDQLVNSPSYYRYCIDGSFDLTDAQSSVLDDLHKACAGEPTYMAGKHGLLVGAYYGPATMEIREGQIISDVKIVPEARISEKLNIVTGTFLDPDNQYTETEFPPVAVAQYISEDGSEFTDDLKLRFVANVYQAQQLAQLKINRTRIGRTLSFTMNLSGYQYRPGFYVKLYLPSLGINGQEFRITEWDFAPNNGVNITLKQETAAVWGDAIGKPIERPDITDFPNASVPQPINLVYTVTEIGEVVQGVLSWTNIGPIAYNIVTIRSAGKVVLTIQVPGQTTPITGLVRGTYDVGVTAVSQMGARSAEAYTQIVINAPDMPSSCEIGQGYFEVTLTPRLAQITNVSTQFDFWTSGETRLSDSSVATVTTRATRKGIGNSWTSSGLQIGHTYYWYIRSINAFGASAFLEVAALCDSDIAQLGDLISKELEESAAFDAIKEPARVSIEAALNNAIANKANVNRQYEQLGAVKAEIIRIDTTIVETNKAIAQVEEYVNTEVGDLGSTVAEIKTSVTDLERTSASYQQQVESKFQSTDKSISDQNGVINNLSAVVQTKMTSEVRSDGTASATYGLNLGINRNGVYYGAGMAMSIEPSGGGYKSTTLFKADQFGIYSSVAGSYRLAFAVVNGQVYLEDALIRDASIVNTKIGNYIQSNDWDGSGNVGWHINKSGYATFNGVTVRGTIYASNGEFRGTVYATNGSFKGSVEATSFVGDVANTGVYPDTSARSDSAVSASIPMAYMDSSNSFLNKNAIVDSLVYVRGLTGAVVATVQVTIAGNVRTFTYDVPVGGVWFPAKHAVTGLGGQRIEASIVVSSSNATMRITAATMTVTRGTGSFS